MYIYFVVRLIFLLLYVIMKSSPWPNNQVGEVLTEAVAAREEEVAGSFFSDLQLCHWLTSDLNTPRRCK